MILDVLLWVDVMRIGSVYLLVGSALQVGCLVCITCGWRCSGV